MRGGQVRRRDAQCGTTGFVRASAVIFAIILLAGGGGAPNPVFQTALEMLAAGWLCYTLWVARADRPVDGAMLRRLLPFAPLLLLGIVQLVPLPFAWWSALPGREAPAQVLAAAGLGRPALPLALDSHDVWAALLALLPLVAVYFAAMLMTWSERLLLVRVALAVACVSALVGAAQVAMPNTPALYLHKKTYFDLPSGLFANRNFQGAFLLLGILLCGLELRLAKFHEAIRARKISLTPVMLACLFAVPLLSLAALATLSRFAAGMVLPVLALSAFVALKPDRRETLVGGGVLAVVAIAGWLGLTSLSQGLLERFQEGGARSHYWPDLGFAAWQYFPFGSGLGTFDAGFRPIESLQLLEPNFLNHAHNDYFEVLIEGGIVGVVLVAAFLVWFATRAIAAWRTERRDAGLWPRRIAAVCIGLTVFHSFFDYPLRTFTLLALFGLLCAILFLPPYGEGSRRSAARGGTISQPRRPAERLGIIGAGVLGILGIGAVGAPDILVAAKQPGRATAILPVSPDALAQAARNALVLQDFATAERLARRALLASPVNGTAADVLGVAIAQRDPKAAGKVVNAAARLGWRNGATQLWMIQQAVAARNVETAIVRAEALARQDEARDQIAALLRVLAVDRTGREKLVAALSRDPAWRPLFLSLQNDIPRSQLPPMVDLLRSLGKTGTPPRPREARAVLAALADNGMAPTGYALHRDLFRKGASQNRLSNSAFSRLDVESEVNSDASPFDWITLPVGESSASIDKAFGEDNRVLYAIAAGRIEGRIAQQWVALTPGTYELRYRVRAEDPAATRRLRWGLRCSSGAPVLFTAPAHDLPSDDWVTERYRMTVSSACAAQVLELRAEGSEGGSSEAEFDDMMIVPAR